MVPAVMRLVGALMVAGREVGDVPVELVPQPTSARATIMSIERRSRLGLISSPSNTKPRRDCKPEPLGGRCPPATQRGGQACSPARTVARLGVAYPQSGHCFG